MPLNRYWSEHWACPFFRSRSLNWYTSIGDLANRFGCAKATIQKALKDSAKLKGWQARHRKGKGSPRASSLTEFVIDNVEQNREPNPSESAEHDEQDAVFARLIEDATPDERADLNSMTQEERQQMVDLIRYDPDKCNRILGRRP